MEQPPAQKTRTRKLPVFEDMPAWGVFVFESHHDAAWRMNRRSHDFLKLLYVLEGSGALIFEDAVVPLAAGHVAIVPVGAKHHIADHPGEPMSLYVLCVSPTVWRSDASLNKPIRPQRLAEDSTAAGRVRGVLRQLLYEQSSRRTGFVAAMQAMALELVVLLAREIHRESADPAADLRHRVERYIEQLDRRFYEATTIDDAATSLGISRRRFTELFREAAGESWLHRVQRLRIAHARHLLQSTDRTVLSIAFECGFGDLSSFYRAFARFERLSPTEWRKSV